MSSKQQLAYLELRASGSSVILASMKSRLPVGEAHLLEKAIERGEVHLPRIRTGRQVAVRAVIDGAISNLRKSEQERNRFMAEGSIAADELRLLIERIERLAEEKQAISEDISEVYKEAKARGFDTKTMREVVKLRKMETQVRREREALLDTYKAALGLDYSTTPLGSSVMQRVVEQINEGALGEGVTATFHPAH